MKRNSRYVWLACALLLGCSSAAAPVSLSPEWPDQPGTYSDTQRAWTRHAVIRSNYEQVLEVYATFKSPAWRAAYLERQMRRGIQPEDQRASSIERERRAFAGAYEVQLLVTTYDFRENDLHKGNKATWKLALIDDRGNRITPESIVRDRRPIGIIKSEFPDLGDFAVAYVARFPHTNELLRSDATSFSLDISSPRGSVSLTWNNKAPTR